MLVYSMDFKVAGITLLNKDGKDPQKEIKRILQEYKRTGFIDEEDLFEGYSNREIKEEGIEVSEYKGVYLPVKIISSKFENEDCFEVYLIEDNKQETHIGYMPKNLVNEAIKWFSKEGIKTKIKLQITGGKVKFVDEVENQNGDYIEKVVTDERNYGGVVYLNFYDDKQIENANQKPTVKEIKRTPEEDKRFLIILLSIVIAFTVIVLVNTYIQNGSFNIVVPVNETNVLS